MFLTAVVPATDGPPSLPRCVEAIEAADDAPDEVLVVTEPPTAGPAEARNVGARRARGDLLVFVDADVIVHPDAFSRIREAFASDPDLTGVIGSYDAQPEAPGPVSGFRNLLHHHVHQTGAGSVRTFWGGLGALRRDAFVAAGGFDADRFPVAIEDVELGMRLTDAGARIRLDPLVQGKHVKAWTLADMVATDLLRRGVPWASLLLERRALPSELNLAWRHRAGAGLSLAALLGVVARRPSVTIAALAALVVVNRSFYALLARERGVRQAAAGVGLHVVHHLTAAAAPPVALLRAAVVRSL